MNDAFICTLVSAHCLLYFRHAVGGWDDSAATERLGLALECVRAPDGSKEDVSRAHVARISLPANNLTGELSSVIVHSVTAPTIPSVDGVPATPRMRTSSSFTLPYLRLFVVSHNCIRGSLSAFAQCPNLTHLDLSHNQLQGPISVDLCIHLPLLQELDLSANHITGRIPDEFGTMGHLRSLKLHRYVRLSPSYSNH